MQASLEQDLLDIITPLCHAVVLRQLNLEALVLGPGDKCLGREFKASPEPSAIVLGRLADSLALNLLSGLQAFAEAAPSAWNALPFHLPSSDSERRPMATSSRNPSWRAAFPAASQGPAAASPWSPGLLEARGPSGSAPVRNMRKNRDGYESAPSHPLPTMPGGPHMCEASLVRELRPLPPTPRRSALPSAWRRVRLMRQT